jgi:hypothetical protein
MIMQFNNGDYVKYSNAFIKSISAPELKKHKGQIVSIGDTVRPNGPCVLSIKWHGDTEAKSALSSNISKA